MDRASRQKINKEALTLNDILDKMDFYTYITFHSKAANTFFSCAH